MNFAKSFILSICIAFLLFSTSSKVIGNDQLNDSIKNELINEFNKKIQELEHLRIADSIRKLEIEQRLLLLNQTENNEKNELISQLAEIEGKEKIRLQDKAERMELLRQTANGYPVLGVLNDTLFFVYIRLGVSSPQERAKSVTARIRKLYDNDFLVLDSIQLYKSEYTYDIVYGELIVASISESDALWYNKTAAQLAEEYRELIISSIVKAKKENSLLKILLRLMLVLVVIGGAWLVIWLLGKAYFALKSIIVSNKDRWLKNLAFKDYTFLTAEQELQVIFFLIKVMRWFLYALVGYITLPIVFSIFPFTRGWADNLFNLIWSPFKGVFIAVWDYIPNLFKILVIYIVMKYFIRMVKYIFAEIEAEKLKITGFHADWAMPTYNIVRFLLYAFMLVLIFPLLPGSDSNIFRGVSVFVGILFSLGSSSAISNMIAGLVITYMRPFKIGDRIKISDTTGIVLEKTLLVTRLRTVKNEIITIPNSSILTGNTTNYSTDAKEKGWIIHTSVTIGYDVPWREMHKALIDAANNTPMIMKEPPPFVWQTSLDDFYVSYQINAHTDQPEKAGEIYSLLHQNIQDVCNERGIEILSPHYRAARDGNMVTIPQQYLGNDYKVPSFNIKIEKNES